MRNIPINYKNIIRPKKMKKKERYKNKKMDQVRNHFARSFVLKQTLSTHVYGAMLLEINANCVFETIRGRLRFSSKQSWLKQL